MSPSLDEVKLIRDLESRLAAMTQERDSALISAADAWNSLADADSVRHYQAMRADRDRLAADVKKLRAHLAKLSQNVREHIAIKTLECDVCEKFVGECSRVLTETAGEPQGGGR